MTNTRNIGPLAALLWIATTAAPAHADGPGAYRPAPRSVPAPAVSEQSAIDAYNQGYAAIQRADHAQALAEASSNSSEKNEAERAARDSYKDSIRHFAEAVRLDASMHEAFTYLGYANRKLGNHAKALAAYEQALRIFPDYPHAIEYQAQAFLGMNRLDEARFNYLRLYALNKGQAAKLLQAMRAWLAANKNNAPQEIDKGIDKRMDISAFTEWVAQRSELTANDPVSASW
jgi:tetratricopeptide (TPR) repeat protein